MLEQQLIVLLLKLAVAASLASILVRSESFQKLLLVEDRTALQRIRLGLIFAVVYGGSVLVRVMLKDYEAVDLGLEGSFLAGVVGGYVSGLIAGPLIPIPAMLHHEFLSLPVYAAAGVLGAVLHDCAPEPDEIWRLSPFIDLSLYRILFRQRDRNRTFYHLCFLLAIVAMELIRTNAGVFFGQSRLFSLLSSTHFHEPRLWMQGATFLTTVFAVTVPLKIWNNSRNENKLVSQQRLLNESRLAALTNQINPHFLFNTLNSIATLIRLNPEEARNQIYRLSNILRRLLRKSEALTTLRQELAFIDDYLGIEMVRFGDKLTFDKRIEPDTLDCLVPSMLLQPLVENSIRHGLSGKVEGGAIRIRSHLNERHVVVSVEDDGVGIVESRLENLFHAGIGVSNVNERLKVLFGNQYRMSVESKPGEGTCTTIEVPLNATR